MVLGCLGLIEHVKIMTHASEVEQNIQSDLGFIDVTLALLQPFFDATH
jgi:hypothetical protein